MVSTDTFITDTVKFVRDNLGSNITDPIGSRPGRERFVMTSYPERPVKYPIITVKDNGIADRERAGMQSTISLVNVPIEIRIWARNEAEKDSLTQDVYNYLRSTQFSGTAPSTNADLHDYKLNSIVNVDEPGKAGIKSKVMEVEFLFVTE